MVMHNAKIYTVNSDFALAQAMAISDGKILAVGTNEAILADYDADEKVDLKGKAVYPGFIDGHCHFLGYGRILFDVDLVGVKSFNEMVSRTVDFFGSSPSGWVKGRGWDNTIWENKAFPTKDTLDALYPNTPVVLRRVDGHAALANQKALDVAGITAITKVAGGDILLDSLGKPTGMLIDNAVDLVMNQIPEQVKARDAEALQKAQANCFAVGLTSVVDAGLPLADLLFLQQEAKAGKLRMRVYQMASHDSETVAYFKEHGPLREGRLSIQSFKCYMDGALGSRGALLLEPYSDDSTKLGLQLTPTAEFHELLQTAKAMDFQVCAHAIGDSAVRVVLNGYAQYLEPDNDKRWRVEHAQVVHPNDIATFGQYGILPSVQSTHATSDMDWADERLGNRISTAYAYQTLLKQNGLLVNGSDFPVEGINPLLGFYAAVARKDADGSPENGFQMENALSREQALKAMTIWAAYGQFAEHEKGSLEKGKLADFVVLDQDIMTIPANEILQVKVLQTAISGETVYPKP